MGPSRAPRLGSRLRHLRHRTLRRGARVLYHKYYGLALEKFCAINQVHEETRYYSARHGGVQGLARMLPSLPHKPNTLGPSSL